MEDPRLSASAASTVLLSSPTGAVPASTALPSADVGDAGKQVNNQLVGG